MQVRDSRVRRGWKRAVIGTVGVLALVCVQAASAQTPRALFEVGEFKKGAFRIAMAAGIPIVPIVIRNAEMIGGRDAATMNPGTVDVVVLEPIPVKGWTLKNLDQKIAQMRQLYVDTLRDWPG